MISHQGVTWSDIYMWLSSKYINANVSGSKNDWCGITCFNALFFLQELRSREEELTKASLQQKHQEEFLRKREEEIAEREIALLERELNIMILQQVMHKPQPNKRRGKFKKSRLQKVLKSGSKSISEPLGRPRTHLSAFVLP